MKMWARRSVNHPLIAALCSSYLMYIQYILDGNIPHDGQPLAQARDGGTCIARLTAIGVANRSIPGNRLSRYSPDVTNA
jgi:hypothetical protein